MRSSHPIVPSCNRPAPRRRQKVSVDQMQRRVGLQVRSARQAKNLSVREAAATGELHWRHWQKIEGGEINLTLQTLVALGKSLDVDPAALLARRERGAR
jgi:ribosome-binding protein aMBF1 (putative translation factor)